MGGWLRTALAGAAWLASSAWAAGEVVPLDRIVCVVNNEVITRHELDEHMRVVTDQLRRRGTALPPRDILEKQLLERLLTERVQLQYARDSGIRVDDATLDRTIERIAQDNKLTMPEFRAALEKDGVRFSRFRTEIRSEILLTRLREREVESKIVVTDQEVENFLATQESQGGREAEYELAHLLVRLPESASPEQIAERKLRAQQALEELDSGKDFAQVAATYSDADDALQGGAMGRRPAARLPQLFVDAVKTLKPGAVSPVLRSPAGFHIVKLVNRFGGDAPLEVEKTRARHILIRPNELMAENDVRNRLTQLRERIENGTDFAELARLHSEDGSASKGGDLGWLAPGDTVPPFENAMNALRPNELSEPVKSPFGWHLIQVLERRVEDVSQERQRLNARQAIRARKAEEAYQDWVRQLRDRAFVEYRLDEN